MAGVIFDGKTVAPAILVEKEIVKTKFGASIDTWIGDVDENGVLSAPTVLTELNFAGVKEIGDGGLYYAFYGHKGIASVGFGSLRSIKPTGLFYAFYDCTGIKSVDLSSLQSVDSNGLSYAFAGCSGITSLDLSSLQTISAYGMGYAFYGCTGITNVDLSSLQRVDNNGLYYAFNRCKNITAISFPSLTNVHVGGFGSSTGYSAFRDCTALAEIHFRADMQATIEAMVGYSSKFGATNATIYFDL